MIRSNTATNVLKIWLVNEAIQQRNFLSLPPITLFFFLLSSLLITPPFLPYPNFPLVQWLWVNENNKMLLVVNRIYWHFRESLDIFRVQVWSSVSLYVYVTLWRHSSFDVSDGNKTVWESGCCTVRISNYTSVFTLYIKISISMKVWMNLVISS